MSDAKKFDIKSPFFAEVTDGVKATAWHYSEELFDSQSPFQRVQVYQTPSIGRALVIDGYLMTAEVDEFVYHEALAHVPALGHPNPKTALIIGGGDGGTARELQRHRSIEKIVIVDIDPEVCRAARECLPELAMGLDHPTTEVIHQDAVQYVAECEEAFDIICVDSTEPVGPGAGLVSVEFFRNCLSLLGREGILAAQTLAPLLQAEDIAKIYANLREVFPMIAPFGAPMSCYPGGYWSFAWASVSNAPMKYFNPDRIAPFAKDLKFLNSDLYPALFVLPNFMLKIVEGA